MAPFVIEGYGLSGKDEFLPGISKMSHLQYMLWKEMRSNNCQSDRGGKWGIIFNFLLLLY